MNYIHITKENLDKEHICCARVLFFTAARSAASALSNIFPQKTHGCPLKQRDISISIACGSQAR